MLTDVDECYIMLYDKFTDLCNACFPINQARYKQQDIFKPFKSINKNTNYTNNLLSRKLLMR